jgi:hypothetical protein
MGLNQVFGVLLPVIFWTSCIQGRITNAPTASVGRRRLRQRSCCGAQSAPSVSTDDLVQMF